MARKEGKSIIVYTMIFFSVLAISSIYTSLLLHKFISKQNIVSISHAVCCSSIAIFSLLIMFLCVRSAKNELSIKDKENNFVLPSSIFAFSFGVIAASYIYLAAIIGYHLKKTEALISTVSIMIPRYLRYHIFFSSAIAYDWGKYQ